MRVSQLDRRRALWRIPKFQADYKLYKTLESENEIALKEIEIERKWGYSAENIKRADEMAKQKRNSPAIRAVSAISRNPVVKFVCGKKSEKAVLFRGDYLYLEIDLQRPDEILQKEFLRIIKGYKSKLPPGRKIASNIRGTNFDIWDIYDAKHSAPPHTTQEIIVNIHGRYYDVGKYQERYEKEIERGFKKAEKIMDFVRQKVPLINFTDI
jgi:hypothetical protein